MAEPTEKPSEKPSEKALAPATKAPPVEPIEPTVQSDEERGDAAYWRERAGRLRTTRHHIAGALSGLDADATFTQADVEKRVREFSGREERKA